MDTMTQMKTNPKNQNNMRYKTLYHLLGSMGNLLVVEGLTVTSR